MAYFTPYIDRSGIHIPTYSDIRDQLISDAKTIFGQDIYLGIDSQDYQWISAVSNIIHDAMQTNQVVYNTRGPATSIGTGLDVIVKLNGLKRIAATYSTCPVIVAGNANTVINKGVVQDMNKVKWDLPSTVIGNDGTVTVIATCQTAGMVAAEIGQINTIVTPTLGWASVNNAVSATIGTDTEIDGKLRSRQATSTAQPSRTVLEGLTGAIYAVAGVTRMILYENDSNSVDPNGLVAHSIAAVVEGGDDEAIANTICKKKTPGAYTQGNISISIVDIYGQSNTIRFYRPSYIDIDVTVNVKSLNGYTTQTAIDIKENIATYLNSLNMGDDLPISSLWGAALATNANHLKPSFSITGVTASKRGQSQGVSDIIIAFNECTRGNIENIKVNVI